MIELERGVIVKRKIKIPAVALRGLTILPDMMIHFDLSRKKSILAVEESMMRDQRLFLVTQKDQNHPEPADEDVYTVGCIVVVKQVTKLPGGVVRVLVEGMERGKFLCFVKEQEAYLLAEVEYEAAVYGQTAEETDLAEESTVAVKEDTAKTEVVLAGTGSKEEILDRALEEAMLRQIKELTSVYCAYYPKLGKTLEKQFDLPVPLGRVLDQLTMNLPLGYESKQKILEAFSVKVRFQTLADILANEIEVAKAKSQIAEEIKGRVEKNQREYLLREQLRYIKDELGDNEASEAEQFMEALEKLDAKKEVKEKIEKEIKRFQNVSGSSSESAVVRGYLETLLELPWDKVSEDNTDIKHAEKVLEEGHYGLKQVKERMLEFLAVRTLSQKGDSPIICLVGPPGTGKTSIVKSVAEALQKQYVRICLGGVRDEAEIRGHRKTYVGAMPGRIAAGLKQAGVKNPLMLLDEIDKVSSDYKGDTSSALLEVLDSEQNHQFRDHYVEIPLDLSEVMFIATANSVETIPRPLLDRMELIEVTSYTANEKFHIAKEHLLPKQLKKHGLEKDALKISDIALQEIIQSYTREAGVRELERKLGEICRKAARKILERRQSDAKEKSIQINVSNLEKYLGKEKYTLDKANDEDQVGIVRGMAWTSVGGETLQIEVNAMPGKGEVELTGQLGDVMKESAMAAFSYVRFVSSSYKIPSSYFEGHDFHIHLPEGAVPKDGPSAGITMATALLSAITNCPVKACVAMTGEITLRGRVLPIGGLKEKLLAAKTSGIKTALVPKENVKDVEEISNEIKNGLHIVFVSNMEEVIKEAFTVVPVYRSKKGK